MKDNPQSAKLRKQRHRSIETNKLLERERNRKYDRENRTPRIDRKEYFYVRNAVKYLKANGLREII